MRKTIVSLSVVAALFALGACSSDDSETTAADETPSVTETPDATEEPAVTEEPTATEEPTETEDPSATEAPAGSSAPAPLEGKIEDKEFGDVVTLKQVVRNFESTTLPAIAEDGGEFVLIEFEAALGEKFSGGLKGTFKLNGPDGTGSQTTAIDTDMEAAGYTPFEAPEAGETASGWLAFQVNSASDSYTLTYDRMGADVIGSDDYIEPKTWDFTVN